MSNVVSRSRKAITPLSTQCLWALAFNNTLGLQFKDIQNWRGPSAGLLGSLQVWRRGWRSSACLSWWRGAHWEPVTTRSDKDDGIKLFTDDTEGTMAQNCPLEGSNWSLRKYSSLEEQRSTGRDYRGGRFYSKSLTWPSASDCLFQVAA